VDPAQLSGALSGGDRRPSSGERARSSGRLAGVGVAVAGAGRNGNGGGSRPSAPVQWWGLLAVALIAGMVFANSLRNGFHYDDIHSLLDNLDIRSSETFPVFPGPRDVQRPARVGMPRPLLLTTSRSIMPGPSMSPGLAAVNYLFHIANALLLYLAVCHLLGRPRSALIAALLFAIHPVNTETVNYVNVRSESMTSCS